MKTIRDDVRMFMEACGQELPVYPCVPSPQVVELRKALIDEEVNHELFKAIDHNDLVGIADGCIDAIYVLVGLLLAYGIDPRPIWDEVQASNMSKLVNGKAVKDANGKVLKPEGYRRPDIVRRLMEQCKTSYGTI